MMVSVLPGLGLEELCLVCQWLDKKDIFRLARLNRTARKSMSSPDFWEKLVVTMFNVERVPLMMERAAMVNGSFDWRLFFYQLCSIRVFCWGKNTKFMLNGNGSHEETVAFEPVEVVPLRGVPVSAIHTSHKMTLAATIKGEVVGWGADISSAEKAQSSSAYLPASPSPIHPDALNNVRLVRCCSLDEDGSDTWAGAVTWDGKVYTWGSNEYLNLGHGDADEVGEWIGKPRFVEALKEEIVKDIGVEWSNGTAVTKSGKVFVWGADPTEDIASPTELPDHFFHFMNRDKHLSYPPDKLLKTRARAISSTADALLVHSDEGQLYLSSVERLSKLNPVLPANMAQTWTPPYKLQDLENHRFRDAAISNGGGGQQHIIALTHQGQVWSFGSNKFGQLGNGQVDDQPSDEEEEEAREERADAEGNRSDSDDLANPAKRSRSGSFPPRPIARLSSETTIKLQCGFNYSVALTDGGYLYAWGVNECGQCASPPCRSIASPAQVSAVSKLYVYDVACGHEHALCVAVPRHVGG